MSYLVGLENVMLGHMNQEKELKKERHQSAICIMLTLVVIKETIFNLVKPLYPDSIVQYVGQLKMTVSIAHIRRGQMRTSLK